MTSQQLHFQGGVKSKFNIHIKCFLIIVEKQRIPSERLKELFHSGLKMRALRLTRGGGGIKQNQCIKVFSSSSSSFIKKHV